MSEDTFQTELQNAGIGCERQLAEVSSAHSIAGGGLIWTGGAESRYREGHVVEQIKELRAEL